jgi:GTP-binding protein Era
MNSQHGRDAGSGHRAGLVAIAGRPNVGKSTLLNRLVGQKVSITSSKPQTTRHTITGIVTRPGYQIAFVDTPGYQTKHRSPLNRMMNRAVAASLLDADAVVWVVEALKFGKSDEAIAHLLPQHIPVVVAINKIDLVPRKEQLLPFIKEMSAKRAFAAIVPVSAHKELQIDALLGELAGVLPEGPRLFGDDEITTANERFLAGELLQEKLFRLLGEELPYATIVQIDEFKVVGDVRHIHGVVLVDKPSQKGIVIGRDGQKLKEIATQARRDMERLFGGRVFLELWVRVKRGWARTEASLRRAGFES